MLIRPNVKTPSSCGIDSTPEAHWRFTLDYTIESEMGVIEVVTETAVELCRWKRFTKKGERRKDGTETSVEVFTELNRRIMLVARGTASEMAKTLKLTRTILGRGRMGRMDRSSRPYMI